MAQSYTRYTGNGVLTDYTTPSNYIDQDHIVVSVAGVTKALTTDYTWLTASSIRFNSAPANGAIILIERQTSRATRLIDWTVPTSMAEEDLDNDSKQAFYMAQEAIDVAERALVEDLADGKYDADSKVIKNVATPVSANDAANKDYVDGEIDAVLVSAGAVPAAANPGDDNKVLKASSGLWSWVPLTVAMISDAVADMKTFLTSLDLATARTNLGLGIGTDVNEYMTTVSQADAEAGTATDRRAWTAQRVSQAVTALQRGIASQAEAEAGADNTKDMTPLRVAQAIAALASAAGTLVAVTAHTTSATHTWNAATTKALMLCRGGGGGGGKGGGGGVAAAGGGEGELTLRYLTSSLGASQSVTIGAGGSAGTSGAGGTGGTTSIGTLLTAVGGSGGGASADATGGSGGTGGTNADIAWKGQGGGAGTSVPGGTIISGMGGGSGGGKGLRTGAVGEDGTRGGGGGGGAENGNGGAGGAGWVLILEFK